MTAPALPGLPDLRPAGIECVRALEARLGPDRVSIDLTGRTGASRDHAWLSPVLSAALPDRVADVVVAPRSVDEVADVLALAYRHGVAVTARGRGTGNYGQAVPLATGIVLDIGAIDGVLDVGDGWMHAGPGASFTRLEATARATGQELAMFPSTVGSTLGGFLGGGAGGIGSIENGFIWDGFVRDLDLLPCWDVPESVAVDADGALPHLHAYGATGVITSARVTLRPCRSWTAIFASFPSFEGAAAAGAALFELDPLPRNISVDDEMLVALLPGHRAMPRRRTSVRVTADASTVGDVERAVADHGGTVELVDRAATSALVSLSFNHVTLRAKRVDPSICHIQVGGPALVERYEEARAALPHGMLHLDALSPGRVPGFGGLLLSRFVDADTLWAGVDRLLDLGVVVIDAHTWAVGGHRDLTATLDAARTLDPLGLLNPGKLAR